MYIGVATTVVLLAAFVDSFNSPSKEDAAAAPAAQNSAPAANSSSVDENLKPIGTVKVANKEAAGGAARSGEEVYKAACAACHTAGVLNAPKLEKADWDSRISKGMDGLMASTINGLNSMPPRGGNPDISDEELSNAIVYMTGQAGHDLSAQVKATQTTSDAGNTRAASAATDQLAASTAPAVPQTPVAPVVPSAPVASPAPAPAAPPPPQAPAAPAPTKAMQEQLPAAQEAAPAAAGIDGEKVYKSSCFTCHDVGIANSPKSGDKAAWKQRTTGGMDALYANALNGKGAMPAKGGNPTLSDAEIKAAVDWMITQ